MKTTLQPFSSSPLRLAVLAALAGSALADSAALQLSPVTVTGSRVEAKSFELPYSVDVVDSRQIGEGQLKVNASEALAAVPGLVVLNRQNYAQDLQVSSRGFGARSAFGVRGIKLYSDGIPATNPDGQGQPTFNLDTADHIEVLRGPFGNVYGNSSGGVIQVFSRNGEGAPKISAGFMGGSWGTTKTDIGAEGASGPLGYVLSASRFDTDGYRQHSAATRDQAFAKLTYQIDPDSHVQFIASSFNQKAQDPLGLTWNTYQTNPRGVENSALQYNTRKDIEQLQGGVTYDRRFGEHQIQLQAYSGNRSVIQFQSIPKATQLADQRQSGGVVSFDREFQGGGARWNFVHPTGAGELALTAGIEYDYSKDGRRGYENFIGNTLGVQGKLRRNESDTVTSFDQYAQAQLKAGLWTWSAGVRHSTVKFDVDDHYIVARTVATDPKTGNPNDSGSVDYNKTTPSVGLAYQLTPATNIYVSAATGFETPTFNELSYSGTGGGFGFNLKPSRSQQLEAGLKSLVGEKARINADVFEIRTQDELVVFDSTGGRTTYQNASGTLRQGFELGLQAEIAHNWLARAAFTQMRAIYDEDFVNKAGVRINAGNRMPGIPATTLYGEVAWTPIQGYTAAVETVYRSHMYVEDSNTAQVAPSYAIANLRFSAEQRTGQWRLSEMLRFDNVFDRKYIGSVQVAQSSGQYYEPGSGFGWFAGMRAQYMF